MKKLFLICLCLVSIGSSKIFAQKPSPYTIEMNADSLFQTTLQYLQNNDYFIDCIDTPSRFIKAKTYTKNKKWMQRIVGQRTELSILISPIDREQSSMTVTIYQATLEPDESLHYSHKEGIDNDSILHQTIIHHILSDTNRPTGIRP